MFKRSILRLGKPLFVLQSVFVGSIVFSLAGSLFLRLFPETMQFFGPYYTTLVKAPTWTYMAVLPVIALVMYATSVSRSKLVQLFVWACFIGGLSELIGTTTGYPFGEYTYTHWLGAKLFGHVPLFIPLSWFALAVVTYDLAGRIVKSTALQIVLASFFMVLWDVSLDPAMSKAFPFWFYSVDGFFYGMPFVNWVGWMIVSLIIMSGFAVILKGEKLEHSNASIFFVLNCLFPLGISLVAGLYGAVVAGLIATAIPLVLVSIKHKPVFSKSMA